MNHIQIHRITLIGDYIKLKNIYTLLIIMNMLTTLADHNDTISSVYRICIIILIKLIVIEKRTTYIVFRCYTVEEVQKSVIVQYVRERQKS